MDSVKEHTKCLICGEKALKQLFNPKHSLIKCRSCGFVFSKFITSDQELLSYYHDYPSYTSVSSITTKRYNQILDKIEKYRSTGLLIEVGCGNGLFLQEAQKRNWNIVGIELSESAIANCKIKNLTVMHPTEAGQIIEKADVIISLEVLEHLPSPISSVKQYDHLLRTGGVMYMTTPNFNSLSRFLLGQYWNNILLPEHLGYFTKQSVRKMFSQFKYKEISLKTSGISPGRIIYRIKELRASKMHELKEYDYNQHDRTIMETIEGNFFLSFIKASINKFLALTSLGDTLKFIFQKM